MNARWPADGSCTTSGAPRSDAMKVEADQNLIVYFDGRYMPMRDAHVGILTHALHYGTGVFEGIRAHWDEAQQELFVLRPNEHYERWKQNCGILRIDIPAYARRADRHHPRSSAPKCIPHQCLHPSAGVQMRRAHRRQHRRPGRASPSSPCPSANICPQTTACTPA